MQSNAWQQFRLPSDLTELTFLEIGDRAEPLLAGAAQARNCLRYTYIELSDFADLDPTIFKINNIDYRIDFAVITFPLEFLRHPKELIDNVFVKLSQDGYVLVYFKRIDSSYPEYILDIYDNRPVWRITRALFHRLFPQLVARFSGNVISKEYELWKLSRKKTTVTLISGMGSSGKTVRLLKEFESGSIAIRIDAILARLDAYLDASNDTGEGPNHFKELVDVSRKYKEHRLKSGSDTSILRSQIAFAKYIRKNSAVDSLAKTICDRVNEESYYYTIEGGILTDRIIREKIARILERRGMRVWTLSPMQYRLDGRE
jgi:hypothetical protein